MLQLHIGFPAGRFCAACVDDPALPEWPPHPSRVYSALVAAACSGGRQPSPRERQLLELLEQAEPPCLSFPPADTTDAAVSYVPVNDLRSRFGGKSHGPLWPTRQPRHFPVAYLLAGQEVTLGWALLPEAEDLALLDRIAERMTHLGTAHSPVVARFTTGECLPDPHYRPDRWGELPLRVAMPGRLQELDRLYAQRGQGPRRPQPLHEAIVTYARAQAQTGTLQPSAFEWLVFRLHDGCWGADTAHTLGKSLRRAVMALLDQQAPAAVHGHDPQQPHVAWLPLPEVGHPHADGRIRGVGIAIPRSLPANERAITLAALARLTTWRLPDGQLARLQVVSDGPDGLRTLHSQTWAGVSRYWSTVTPVILDRPPKRFDSARIAQSVTESLLHAGYPAPVSVRISQSSDFKGGPALGDIPTQLPRIHAQVEFAEPLQGPVIAGRWKYFGTGLFRPTPVELLP